ncbi:MAG: transglycosylase domain-containing protein [bacterium]|nr:transglycosylase domain-containing protein [bacterium]
MRKTWKKVLLGFVFIIVISLGAGGIVFWFKMSDLPSLNTYKEYHPYQTAYFFDRNNTLMSCLAHASGWRDVIPSEGIREIMIARMVINVEDRRFYERDFAVDLRAIGRALWEDIKAQKIVEGGSTIPQQLVKQLLPKEERERKSIERKIKEYLLARRLIRNFTKDEILALYLNEAYFGHQRYGAEAAARFYFDKSISELSISEAATITGLIQSPESLSPKKHTKRAKERRDEVLAKARQEEMITESEYQKAKEDEVITTNAFEKKCGQAPHAIDYARDTLKQEYKIFFDDAGKNDAWFGLRVTLTLDAEMQRLAEDGVADTFQKYEERQKEKAIEANGAVVAIDNATGALLAMVGSRDYSKSKYNHALAFRQPGSAFKPIVYTTLFEEELALGKPRDKILDLPIQNTKIRLKKILRPKGPEDWWEPKNFDEHKYGKAAYTRRFAIAKSINRPAIHAARRVGITKVIAMAKRLHLDEKYLQPYLPTAIGASEVPLLKLAQVYAVFPNQGVFHPAYIVRKINDANGTIIYEKNDWEKEQVISETLAGLMVEALRGVVKFGTASSLHSLAQPTACKTGTTNEYTDAALYCFTPDITVAAWIGSKDKTQSLGEKETGAIMAGPVVKFILENWYNGQEPNPFPEETEDWNNILKDSDAFKKEIKEHGLEE